MDKNITNLFLDTLRKVYELKNLTKDSLSEKEDELLNSIQQNIKELFNSLRAE